MTKKKSDVKKSSRKTSGPLPSIGLGKKKKQKYTKPPLQNKILNIIVISVVLFAIWQVSQNKQDETPLTTAGQIIALADLKIELPEVNFENDPRIENLVTKHKVNVFSQLSAKMRPLVTIKTIEPGEGAPVFCGQKVSYQLLENAEDDTTTIEVKTIRLGESVKETGLSLGMIGMRPGELRLMEIPTDIWTHRSILHAQNKNPTYPVLVRLVEAKESAPVSQMPLKRYLRDNGAGEELRCGDIAILDLTIWDSNGTQLFSSRDHTSKAVYAVTGQGTLPFGVEQAILQMLPNGKYSFVIPHEMFSSYVEASTEDASLAEELNAQTWPTDLALPEDRAIIMDVQFLNRKVREDSAIDAAEGITSTPFQEKDEKTLENNQ